MLNAEQRFFLLRCSRPALNCCTSYYTAFFPLVKGEIIKIFPPFKNFFSRFPCFSSIPKKFSPVLMFFHRSKKFSPGSHASTVQIPMFPPFIKIFSPSPQIFSISIFLHLLTQFSTFSTPIVEKNSSPPVHREGKPVFICPYKAKCAKLPVRTPVYCIFQNSGIFFRTSGIFFGIPVYFSELRCVFRNG